VRCRWTRLAYQMDWIARAEFAPPPLTQGNGTSDSVQLIGVNGSNSIGGTLSITQGNGSGDLIDIEDSVVSGNALFQVGNGSGDEIDVETTSSDGTSLPLTGMCRSRSARAVTPR
jgi:hypothetical protein